MSPSLALIRSMLGAVVCPRHYVVFRPQPGVEAARSTWFFATPWIVTPPSTDWTHRHDRCSPAGRVEDARCDFELQRNSTRASARLPVKCRVVDSTLGARDCL